MCCASLLPFLRPFRRCTLHTAKRTKAAFAERDNIIIALQKSICTQSVWHIASSVLETSCKKGFKMASKPVFVPFDWLIRTILHLAMIIRTYKFLWCMQGQHWSNGFCRTLYVVHACCLFFGFFFTPPVIVRAMWPFLRLFTRCTLHTAKWTKGSFVERDNIINAPQTPFSTQLLWHIASSVSETCCKKRLRNGYKARLCDI